MSYECYPTLLRAATRRLAALYDEALAPFGVNIAQFSLLRMIRHAQPVSLTDLGHRAQLDRSTVGRNVRVLERMELVSAGRGKDDQRQALISLTGAGEELLKRTGPVWRERQASIETRIGAEKITALRDILDTL
ncbi:MarR family transcriptional regulator (plasmid) [Paroceanicella profunda]|uniref:MarR family transcriptional regulator n=1 Tax=Paroceanicella profunda TaxID=2579971 RepID=A0A5B8FK00_9RHOB|nr:MarR family transcriptional regulator [Paroceanicella profunda]QDL94928.1 MarR family transcriptional regulator [Paroceanicella profunda]